MRIKPHHRLVPISVFVFALTLFGPALSGQAVAIASVTGRVTDPTGATLPNAQVTITDIDTGSAHPVTTNGSGQYTLGNLPVGPYQLEVAAAGFQTYKQIGIVLQVNDSVQLNVTMQVGTSSETVEVEANASMVQTQTPNLSQVIDGKRIVELPLNGRDPTQLITISGAAVNHSDGTNTGSKSFFSSQSISIAGGLGNQTNYLLDGGDNVDSFTNVNLPFPFPDALAEFSVETSSLPARNGLHPGGLVNAVTRSGTNKYHGDAFEFVRNGDVNATNFFGKPDSLKRNQFGGIFGGPVKRDKLFFFVGFQQSNIRQDPTNNTAYVPTAAMLAGDFSACNSGNKVNPATFDKSSLALVKYLPVSATTDPCGKTSYGTPIHSDEQQYVGRADWTISPKHSFYGRYFIDRYRLMAFFNPTDVLVTSTSGNYEKAQSLTMGDAYTLTPSLVNSLHVTFTRRRDDRGPAAQGLNMNTLGATNVYQGTSNYLQVTVGGSGFAVGSGSGALGSFNITEYQEADDIDWQKGKHSLAFGVDIIRTQDNQNNHFEDNGSWLFDGRFNKTSTGANEPLEDFLLGQMYRFEQSLPQQNATRQTSIGIYAQDTWHATTKLVLSYGLRWEPYKYPYDYFHRGSTFSQANFNSGTHSQVYVNAPPGTLFYGDSGVTPSMSDDRYTNFSPRLGLNYNPDGEGKTVFRVGGAMMYDSPATFMNYRVIANNLPYGATIANQNGPYQFSNPWANVVGGNPFPLPQIPSKTTAFPLAGSQVLTPRHIHSPIVYQYNVGMQHQFGKDWIFSLSYLGNRMNHSWIGNEINPGTYIPGTSTGVAGSCGALTLTTGLPKSGALCSSTSNTQNRRILSLANPAFGQYYSTQVIANDGTNANYNGLLTSMEHRFAHNYTVLTNYTWSKCLNIGPITTLATEGAVQNPYNIRSDYGACTSDARHNFNLSIVASSTWHGNALAKAALAGWQIAPLVRVLSGTPFNVTTGADNSQTGINLDRPNVVAGVPVSLNAPHLKTGIAFINPSAFTPNAQGTFGNVRHFGYVGPRYTDVDLSVSRNFHLFEQVGMQLRVDGFNVLNHPNFSPPPANLASSSAFGRITAALDPRILQGVLKFTF